MNNQDQNNIEALKEMVSLIAERDALKAANAELQEKCNKLSQISPDELETLIHAKRIRAEYCPVQLSEPYIRKI